MSCRWQHPKNMSFILSTDLKVYYQHTFLWYFSLRHKNANQVARLVFSRYHYLVSLLSYSFLAHNYKSISCMCTVIVNAGPQKPFNREIFRHITVIWGYGANTISRQWTMRASVISSTWSSDLKKISTANAKIVL